MPALTTILGGAAALGSAIYGAIKSSKYNKQADRLIQNQRDENKRWYDIKMSQDYTQRADVQNAINRQREMLDEQYNRAKQTAKVAGGSDAALAAQKEAANKSLSDTMSNVASNAADYKDKVESQYRQQDAALNQQQAEQERQKAQAAAAAASQGVNAGLNLVGIGASMQKEVTDAVTGGLTGKAGTAIASQPDTNLSPQTVQGPDKDILGNDKLPKTR